jgi:hypothetical protein
MQRLRQQVAPGSLQKTLLTYAKKVTVSVLYWYARSFRYIRQSLDTTPKGVDFFLPNFRTSPTTTGTFEADVPRVSMFEGMDFARLFKKSRRCVWRRIGRTK